VRIVHVINRVLVKFGLVKVFEAYVPLTKPHFESQMRKLINDHSQRTFFDFAEEPRILSGEVILNKIKLVKRFESYEDWYQFQVFLKGEYFESNKGVELNYRIIKFTSIYLLFVLMFIAFTIGMLRLAFMHISSGQDILDFWPLVLGNLLFGFFVVLFLIASKKSSKNIEEEFNKIIRRMGGDVKEQYTH
jgi:hypothetical protein